MPNPANRVLKMLERRKVVTTNPAEALNCCGLERDADGFCVYRPGHPIYVSLEERRSDG